MLANRRLLVLLLAAGTTGSAHRPPGPSAPGLAAEVLRAATSFERGGGYRWKDTGTPEEIRFAGEVVLARSAEGTYCCGYTFAVAMRVITAEKLARRKDADAVRAFQKQWYGAAAGYAERQCAAAVESLGVGREVGSDRARAGDFVQLWRRRADGRPSGHSAVFLGWVVVDGERVGISYLSSQAATGGIGYNVEYFVEAGLGGTVDPSRVYFARLGST